MSVKKLKKVLKKPKAEPVSQDLLSTGVTTLNLAASGKFAGAFPKGMIILLVGDSNSGKTVLSMNMLAQASIDPNFDGYDLIFDNAEQGRRMPLVRYYGQKLADRIEPPGGTWDKPEDSDTLEEFYDVAEDRIKARPCVYVLDSMDCLRTRAEVALEEENKKKRQKGGKEAGSFQMTKPKINSARLRELNNLCAANGSILVIITQTRQNIGFGSQFQPKTRSGGDSLRFYARFELWLTYRKGIVQAVHGVDRKIGRWVKADVVKNHLTGWEGKVLFPIYRAFGIDDTGLCVEYLVEERHWKKGKSGIEAKEFGVTLPLEKLVAHIEEKGLQVKLKKIVKATWQEVESQLKIERKSPYS